MKTSNASKAISSSEDLLQKTIERLQALSLSRKEKMRATTKKTVKDDFYLFPRPRQSVSQNLAVFGLPLISKNAIDACII